MTRFPLMMRWPNGRTQAAFDARDEALMREYGCVEFDAGSGQIAVASLSSGISPEPASPVAAEPKRRGRPPKVRN